MTDPQWQVQAAFGKTFRDTGNIASGDWTDLSVRVRGFTFKRGRQLQSGTMEAGTATVQLSNADRQLDPTNAAGPYFGKLVPMVPVRILAVHASTTYPAFFGYAEQWPVKWTFQYDSVVDLPLTDALGVLARQPVGDSLWDVWAKAAPDRVLWWRMSASGSNVPVGATVKDYANSYDGTLTNTHLNPAVLGTGMAAASVPSLKSGDTDGALALLAATGGYNGSNIARDDGVVGVTTGAFTFQATIKGTGTGLATGTLWTIFEQANAAFTQPGFAVYAQCDGSNHWYLVAAQWNNAGTQFASAAGPVVDLGDGNPHVITILVGVDPFNTSTGIMRLYVDSALVNSATYGLQTMPYGLCTVGPFPGNGLITVDEVFLSAHDSGYPSSSYQGDLEYLTGYNTARSGIWYSQEAQVRVITWLLLAGFDPFFTGAFSGPTVGTTLSQLPLSGAPSNAMAGIKDVMDTEQGVFWSRRDGTFKFLGFAERTTVTRYSTSQATFGRPATTGQIAVDGADPIISDIDRIVNKVAVSIPANTGTGYVGYATTNEDDTSIAQYGEQRQSPTYMTEDRAQAIVTRYAQPKPRFPQVVLEPGFDATATAFVLGSELQDRVTVTAQPPGGGAALTTDAHIQGETWTVNPDKPWQVTYDLDLGL